MSLSLKTRVLNIARDLLRSRAAEKILLSCVRGARLGSLIAKIPPNHYQYPSASCRRAHRFGVNFELEISELVDWAVFYEFSEPEQELFYRLTKPGFTVLDIGANIGSTMMRFALAVGPKGRVFGFEPDPESFSRCLMNLSLNFFSNLVLENIAAGKSEGYANLYCVDSRNPGMNRILPLAPENAKKVSVNVISLDSYVSQKKVGRVDAIKIDVEGFEINVLKGAEMILRSDRPLLFIELSDSNLRANGGSAAELIDYLYSLGANVRSAATGLEIAPGTDLSGIKCEIIGEFFQREI